MSKATERVNGTVRAALRQARRLVVFVVGMTVLLVGIIMIVTPGPAVVVIPAGLGILALEFAWARRLLVRVKEQALASVKLGKRGEPCGGASSAHDGDR